MSFYVVPMIGTGTRTDPFVPQYVGDLGVQWAVVRWNGTGIVWADATPAQDATIAANADAIVIPPLDDTIALSATKSELEALNIPTQWVTAGMTYRTVLRVVCGMAQLLQRIAGNGVTLSLAGNLDKTMSQFSATVRTGLSSAATSLGLDVSSITGSTTLREALRICGQQFVAGTSIHLGDL